MQRSALAIACLLTLAACGSRAQQDAQQTKDVLTGDTKGAAANNPLCKLFSPAEAGAYIGEPVNAGENAGMGQGCQWSASDGDGSVMIVAVPTEYTEIPSLAKDFREVPELGEKGYVVPELGGWDAGAVVGNEFLKASTAGNKASADTVIALFKDYVKRKK